MRTRLSSPGRLGAKPRLYTSPPRNPVRRPGRAGAWRRGYDAQASVSCSIPHPALKEIPDTSHEIPILGGGQNLREAGGFIDQSAAHRTGDEMIIGDLPADLDVAREGFLDVEGP